MTGEEPNPPALTGHAQIARTDRLDERVMEHLENRFSQAETRAEADRTHEFLKIRMEKSHREALRRVFDNRPEVEEKLSDEARFIRAAKTMFGLTRQEAFRSLGCDSYARFVAAESEMARPALPCPRTGH